jgi:hypothetical protein
MAVFKGTATVNVPLLSSVDYVTLGEHRKNLPNEHKLCVSDSLMEATMELCGLMAPNSNSTTMQVDHDIHKLLVTRTLDHRFAHTIEPGRGQRPQWEKADLVLVPILRKPWWMLGVVDRNKSQFAILDPHPDMTKTVFDGVSARFKKYVAKFDSARYTQVIVDSPKQTNVFDCAVFGVLKTIDITTFWHKNPQPELRQLKFSFTQDTATEFRRNWFTRIIAAHQQLENIPALPEEAKIDEAMPPVPNPFDETKSEPEPATGPQDFVTGPKTSSTSGPRSN